MDIINYAGKVKTFKASEIMMLVQSLDVGANDLIGKVELVKANSINLDNEIETWFVTKSIQKNLASSSFKSPFLNAIEFNARCIAMVALDLKRLVGEYKDKIWDGKLLTIKQANILNTIEMFTFWVNYSQTLLDVLITMSNEGVAAEKYMTGHDLKHVNDTKGLYEQLSIELLKGSKYFVKRLEAMHDVPVDENSVSVLESTEGKGQVDILTKGFGIHLVTPIFWVSLARSRVQLARIEQMRRKNEQFAMKISQAINLKQGNDDPQLDRRIEVYQDAIIKNEAAIARIEASYE